MSSRPLVLAALAALTTAVAATPAAARTTTLISYKTSVDVDLTLIEKSHWQGIRDGCFAPAENFDATYTIDVDTSPKGANSTVRNGAATITPQTHGATSTIGDTGSFQQRMVSAPWELQTAYPPGAECGPDPAPAPPEWATSPTCKPVNERVLASLIANTVEDPDGGGSSAGGDGSLILGRARKANVGSPGGTMGARCLRTLHNIAGEGQDSEIALLLKSTFIQVPIPGLKPKLLKLAQGKKNARPSFTVKISVGGDCNAMQMKPFLARRDDFVKTSFTQPLQALGSFNGEEGRTTCLISGSGRAIVRRVGAVTRTTFTTP